MSIPILIDIILLEYTLIHCPSFDLSVGTPTSHTLTIVNCLTGTGLSGMLLTVL